jgi:hypothetical protein
MSFARLFIPLVCSLLFASPGHAFTIDAFHDDGFISSTATAGATKTIHIPSTQVVRGGRSLSATKSGSGTGGTAGAIAAVHAG